MELLIVVAILGVMAAVLLPRMDPTAAEQLSGAARILTTDLAYARNLAVTNSSRYEIAFSRVANAYWLQHAGTNPDLDELPETPFRRSTDTARRQVQRFDDLPTPGFRVVVVGVELVRATPEATSRVVFTELGGTTATAPTRIWLSCGSGRSQRSISITVDPVTGLATIGDLIKGSPSIPVSAKPEETDPLSTEPLSTDSFSTEAVDSDVSGDETPLLEALPL